MELQQQCRARDYSLSVEGTDHPKLGLAKKSHTVSTTADCDSQEGDCREGGSDIGAQTVFSLVSSVLSPPGLDTMETKASSKDMWSPAASDSLWSQPWLWSSDVWGEAGSSQLMFKDSQQPAKVPLPCYTNLGSLMSASNSLIGAVSMASNGSSVAVLPPPPGLGSGLAFLSSRLPKRLLGPSSLAVEVCAGGLRPLTSLENVEHAGPLRLRHGMLDLRVVLRKAIPAGQDLSNVARSLQPHVLWPVAAVVPADYDVSDEASSDRPIYLAYPFCEKGTMMEWLAARRLAGCLPTAAEAARVVHTALLAVEELLADGSFKNSAIVGAIRPTEMFFDINDAAQLRAPLPPGCTQKTWSSASQEMKWQSPEEAVGTLENDDDLWRAISYRLGLLLWCLGSKDGTINPSLASTHAQSLRLSGLFASLTQSCLRTSPGTYGPPDRAAVRNALEAMLH